MTQLNIFFLHHGLLQNIEYSSLCYTLGFPGGSVGKESACNAGDPGSILGSGRSAGEGIGYPLQYSGLENFMDKSVRSQRVRHD